MTGHHFRVARRSRSVDKPRRRHHRRVIEDGVLRRLFARPHDLGVAQALGGDRGAGALTEHLAGRLGGADEPREQETRARNDSRMFLPAAGAAKG